MLLDSLLPAHGHLAFSEVFGRSGPALRLPDQSEVQLRYYSGPVYRAIREGWQSSPSARTGATTAP